MTPEEPLPWHAQLKLARGHLSITRAARAIDVTDRQWQRWEKGSSYPRSMYRERLAATYGIEFPEPATPEANAQRIEDIDGRLERIEQKLDALIAERAAAAGDGKPVTAEMILDEMNRTADMLHRFMGRLGESIGRRELRARRGEGLSRQSPGASA